VLKLDNHVSEFISSSPNTSFKFTVLPKKVTLYDLGLPFSRSTPSSANFPSLYGIVFNSILALTFFLASNV